MILMRTWIGGIPFNIGSIHKILFKKSNIQEFIPRGNCLVPGVTPFFHKEYQSTLCVPKRLQPSPWWVIWRSLDKTIPRNLANCLKINGISMDTF
jgi:hypothetical protein